MRDNLSGLPRFTHYSFARGGMKRIRRIATISTAITILALFFISNTALALPAMDSNGVRPPCYPIFDVPFTAYSFRLPLWMWGLVPLSVLAFSALIAVTSWVILLVRWRALSRNDTHRPVVDSR
jgi:hypothetical protein